MNILIFILGVAGFLGDFGDWLRRSWRRFFGAAAALALLSAIPGPAAAQARQCGAHETSALELAERFNEVLMIAAASHKGARMELWVSPDGATWTALLVRDGLACAVDHGEGVEFAPEMPAAAPEGDPL